MYRRKDGTLTQYGRGIAIKRSSVTSGHDKHFVQQQTDTTATYNLPGLKLTLPRNSSWHAFPQRN